LNDTQIRDKTGANGYRWVILAIATVGLVISNGLAIGGIPVFYTPMRLELTSIGSVPEAGAQSFIANGAIITFLMSGIFSFVGGWALTRIGIRKSMIFGSLVLGLSFVIHSQAESIWLIYFCRFLMGASLGFVGVTPSVILVSDWFGKRKGTALGILLTGTSIGGFIMPVVFAKLIELYKWRTAMLVVSLFVWIILLPLVVFFVREPPFQSDAATGEPIEGMTLSQALGTPQFWIVSAAAAMIFYTIFVTTQQFILYLQSPAIGLSLAIASAWQSILFALSVTGKSAAGLLSDRFTSSRITLFSTAMMFVSTLLLLLAGAPFLFLIIYGLGYGATFVMLQRLVADYFGRRDYGRILGTITMIEIFGGAVGGRVTGYLADRSGGDYSTAFYAMIGITGAAFICMLLLVVLGTKPKESAAS
jgi:MFS family permease